MDQRVVPGQLGLDDAGLADAAFTPETTGEQSLPAQIGTQAGEHAAPRIRRLWVRNFKGFENFEVQFGDFNVLAGANNSGKSTLLQAADLLFRLVELHREGDHLAPGRNVPPSFLPVAQLRDLWFRQRYRAANRFVAAIIGAQFYDESTVEFGLIGPFGAATSKVLQSNVSTDTFAALSARPTVWVPSSVGVVRDEEFRPAARRLGLIFTGRHNEVLRNLVLDLQRQGVVYDELQDLLRTYFGGVLGDVHFDDSVDQFVTATYAAGDVQHDLYSVGAGFQQVLQLLSFVLGRNPGVVLLDEPDAHLHSSLQRTVVDVLDELSKRRGIQVVMSTHSKEIINYVDQSRLILVERGVTSASPLGAAVTQLAVLQSLGELDNVDAYALVKNKRCLFLEGTTDVPIIERFAARLGLRQFIGDDRVVIVPVGGSERFEHVEQLNVIESLLGAPLVSFELRDRDGRNDAARAEEMDTAARPLHIYERDCIESYLIHPGVIARVVAAVSTERGGDASPGPDDIEAVVLEETETLRDVAIDRAADRYQKDGHRRTRAYPPITEANRAAREFVDMHWTTFEDRLNVIPGKRLLAAVRGRLQTEFDVSFGNARLVEEFTDAEIVAELNSVLHNAVVTTQRRSQ